MFVTAAQMAKVDELAINKYKITLPQMMELAGYHLATLAKKQFKLEKDSQITVLAGKGNNGGGGLVAARHLYNWGHNVQILLSQIEDIKPRVKNQIQTLSEMEVSIQEYSNMLSGESDLFIDALLGYSIKGAPRSPISDIIVEVNDAGSPVLSLDLPSGLDATTGQPYIPCIRTNSTLTLALPKTGFRNPEAHDYVGRVFLADIGLPPALYVEMDLQVGNVFHGEGFREIKIWG